MYTEQSYALALWETMQGHSAASYSHNYDKLEKSEVTERGKDAALKLCMGITLWRCHNI